MALLVGTTQLGETNEQTSTYENAEPTGNCLWRVRDLEQYERQWLRKGEDQRASRGGTQSGLRTCEGADPTRIDRGSPVSQPGLRESCPSGGGDSSDQYIEGPNDSSALGGSNALPTGTPIRLDQYLHTIPGETWIGESSVPYLPELEECEGESEEEAEGVNEPTSTQENEPQPEDTPAPAPEPAPVLTEVEAVICGVFGDYCLDALAVARCESGDDYYAPPATYHTGTFQLAFRYHAGKFGAHGWDMWATGDDIYQNSVVAFEIFAGRGYSWLGTSGWPVCGWEAGY